MRRKNSKGYDDETQKRNEKEKQQGNINQPPFSTGSEERIVSVSIEGLRMAIPSSSMWWSVCRRKQQRKFSTLGAFCC
jgi:hypothetical protein